MCTSQLWRWRHNPRPLGSAAGRTLAGKISVAAALTIDRFALYRAADEGAAAAAADVATLSIHGVPQLVSL